MSRNRSHFRVLGVKFGRLHGLMAAGLIDSFGLALGWTVFNLHAVTSQGLATVGVYNAAMLGGIALSAPATAFLSTRLDGRLLLQTTAVAEAAFRVGSFVLLLQGAPVAVVACSVAVMNILAWTGYAGMRAEVAAVSGRAAAMTGYMVCIASIEAVGAAVAALLPVGSSGTVTGSLLVAVIAWYAACLVPQLVIGQTARVLRSARRAARFRMPPRLGSLSGGFLVMLLASGPTLLSVGLAAEFHGRSWVAASAVAFTAGSLAAPLLAGAAERSPLPALATWPWLGAGMIAGWVAAPWHPGGLLLAQVLAGLCMTTFEGTMDARAAAEDDGRVTAGLAWSASARALGSSIAVALVPVAVAVSTVQAVSAASASLLGAAGLVALAAPLLGASLVGPGRRRPVAAEASAERQGVVFRIAPVEDAGENPTEWLAPVVRLRAEQRALEPISPELVLVDPELARRLLEPPAELVPLLRPSAMEGWYRSGSAAARPATQPA